MHRQPKHAHRGTHFCRHCDHEVTPVRPGSALVLRCALALTTLGGVLAVLASSLIGPFIMFAVPFMALYGFALGPLHWLATMPAVCPSCRRETPYRSREEARASVRGDVSSPARTASAPARVPARTAA